MKKPTNKIQQFKVVFNNAGDLCQNIYPWMYQSSDYKCEDNVYFLDSFEYTGYYGASGGNSHIIFKSTNSGRIVNMFMSDFDFVIKEKKFIDNIVVGLFCYCKKVNKQGVRLIIQNAP